MKQKTFRMLLCLLLLTPLHPAAAKDLACQGAVVPYSISLGVREPDGLHLYTLIEGQWTRARGAEKLPSLQGVDGITTNERLIGLVQGPSVHFYESGSKGWTERGTVPLPKLDKGEVVVNGLYSTEKELLVVGPTRLVSYAADGEHVMARYQSSVLPDKIDCAFDAGNFTLAIVSGEKVLFYRLAASEEVKGIHLVPLPEATYVVPSDADEVTTLEFHLLGIRQGDRVHFLRYDNIRKAWEAAANTPDFDLSKRQGLPLIRDTTEN